MRKIRSFFYKHHIENFMLYIVAGNALVYIADLFGLFDSIGGLINLLGLSPAKVIQGQIWRLITFVFVPEPTSIFFIFITLYLYYMIGSNLERVWGSAKFNMYYFVCMLCSIVLAMGGYFIGMGLGVGYFGLMTSAQINMGLFLAFAWLFPEMQLMLFFIIPIKIKYLGLVYAFIEVYFVITGNFMSKISALASLIGFTVFFAGELYQWVRSRISGTRGSMAYKKKITKIKKNDSQKNYRHRCCICGITDESAPNMQFRYCVKCSGLKEYCMEHVNNHEHT